MLKPIGRVQQRRYCLRFKFSNQVEGTMAIEPFRIKKTYQSPRQHLNPLFHGFKKYWMFGNVQTEFTQLIQTTHSSMMMLQSCLLTHLRWNGNLLPTTLKKTQDYPFSHSWYFLTLKISDHRAIAEISNTNLIKIWRHFEGLSRHCSSCLKI